SPQTVSLSGTGILALTVSPTSLTFGNTRVGNSSKSSTVTLTNPQSTPVSVSISVTGDYTQTNTCGAAVPANKNCSISVVFVPKTAGARIGSVVISGPSPSTVSLTGTALDAVTAAPSPVGVGSAVVGTTNTVASVALTNQLAVPVAVSNFAIT